MRASTKVLLEAAILAGLSAGVTSPLILALYGIADGIVGSSQFDLGFESIVMFITTGIIGAFIGVAVAITLGFPASLMLNKFGLLRWDVLVLFGFILGLGLPLLAFKPLELPVLFQLFSGSVGALSCWFAFHFTRKSAVLRGVVFRDGRLAD